MKFIADRPLSDPDNAARKLVELANTAQADDQQRISVELINLTFLRTGGTPDEYRAGLDRAIAKGLADPSHVRLPREIHPSWRRPRSPDLQAMSAFGVRRTCRSRAGMSAFDPGCVKTRFWWEGRGRIDGADFMLGSPLSIRRRPECALPVSYCRPEREGPFLYRRS
jgi:hypothetical protein